jgi:hypothetical protein
MIEQDTIRLLRECDAGIKMGIESIDDILPKVKDETFKNILAENRKKHIELKEKIKDALSDFQDDGKEPLLFAQIMSQFKTSFKTAINPTDNAIANLITDGGNMGVKSLNRYLNEYQAADENSKNITKKLIAVEERLVADTKEFL